MKTATGIEIYMLGLINAERKAHGLKPLALERNLNAAAEEYSETLLRKGHFSHTGPDGSSVKERIADARFDMSGGWSIGENLAAGTLRGGDLRRDVEALHEGLMNSPGHRANILKKDYTHVGIGIEMGDFDPFSGRPTMMITQNFGASTGKLDAQIDGTSRSERLYGGSGDDVVAGSGGNDRIGGKSGNDTLSGGTGSDRLYGDGGSDRIYGNSGNDRLYGGSGNDKLYGGSGRDQISGSSGSDWIKGGSGNDTISGGSGNDKIYGESGRDRIDGGTGNDRLYGGRDADTFVFRDGSGTDRIQDFNAKSDRLLLDEDLWNGKKSASQVLRAFGEETDRGVELDFGSDHLILVGVDDLSDLSGRIDFL